MKNLWTIHGITLGYTEVDQATLTGSAPGLKGSNELKSLKMPHVGCYLTNGERHILVDTGLSDEYLTNNPFFAEQTNSVGGESFIIEAFEKLDIELADIDTVVYTHLHNDHAGNCHLFPNAVHVFQKKEWAELINPLPSMKPLNFDQGVIAKFEKMKCVHVDGDFEYLPGIKFMLTPGHSGGSQSLIVDTKDGRYAIVGDLMHVKKNGYGDLTEIITMEGDSIPLPPVPAHFDDILPNHLIYDHYAWYKSIYNIKAMFPNPDYVIPGHEPSVVNRVFG